MPPTQKNRLLAISTALGTDKLLLRKFSLTEQLGRVFQMEVELQSEDRAIKFDDIVGTNATVLLKTPKGKARHFNGYISRFIQAEVQGSFAAYRATIVPWLWFLTRASDCRIFQKQTVPDIIEEVFKGHGFKDYKLKLSATYTPWDYCVQYRETDFNFVSRLMEEEGIYYFFEHKDGAHTMMLTDSPSAHEPFPDYDTLIYRPPTTKQEENSETVTDWVIEQEVQPGLYTLGDFNHETPKASILGNANISRNHQASDFEVFDYPGGFEKRDEGEDYAKLRIQELQAQHEVLRAQTTVRGVATGSKFTLKSHPRADQNRAYLITGASVRAAAGGFETGADKGGDFYECSFTAIPAAENFRTQRTTPKPMIRGPQTAIVVGPKGEEIHTDEHGRVKVHFHWDRHGKFDENASCWIRVSQANAGKGWGSMITPRIGQEVIVEFLEGDPDRPIITGRVYNADQTPPFGAGKGVVSGLKSKTHKGGGANELSLDDTAGKENFKMNAQFDMNTAVGNNQSNTVSVDQTESVGANRTIEIGANDKQTVGGNRDVKISGNHTENVTGNDTVSISGKSGVTIGGKSTLSVGGKRSETIAGAHSIMNPKMSITSASKFTVAAGSKLSGTSAAINLAAGSKFKANSGGKMDVKAGSKLTQQSGAAMNIKSGAALKTQSSAAMSLKSGAAFKAQAAGAMNLKADGALSQKASVIKLNSPTKVKGTTLTVE